MCAYYTLSFEECGAIPRARRQSLAASLFYGAGHSRECKAKQNKSNIICALFLFTFLEQVGLGRSKRDALWNRTYQINVGRRRGANAHSRSCNICARREMLREFINWPLRCRDAYNMHAAIFTFSAMVGRRVWRICRLSTIHAHTKL